MVFELVDHFLAVALVSYEMARLHRIHQLLRLEVRAAENGDDCGAQLTFASHISAGRRASEAGGELTAELFEVDLFGDHVRRCTPAGATWQSSDAVRRSHHAP